MESARILRPATEPVMFPGTDRCRGGRRTGGLAAWRLGGLAAWRLGGLADRSVRKPSGIQVSMRRIKIRKDKNDTPAPTSPMRSNSFPRLPFFLT